MPQISSGGPDQGNTRPDRNHPNEDKSDDVRLDFDNPPDEDCGEKCPRTGAVVDNYFKHLGRSKLRENYNQDAETADLGIILNFARLAQIVPESEFTQSTFGTHHFSILPRAIYKPIDTHKKMTSLSADDRRTHSLIAPLHYSFWEFVTHFQMAFPRYRIGFLPFKKSSKDHQGNPITHIYIPESQLILISPLFGSSHISYEVHKILFSQSDWQQAHQKAFFPKQSELNSKTCGPRLMNSVIELSALVLESNETSEWYQETKANLKRMSFSSVDFEANRIDYLKTFRGRLELTFSEIEKNEMACAKEVILEYTKLKSRAFKEVDLAIDEMVTLIEPFFPIAKDLEAQGCTGKSPSERCEKMRENWQALLDKNSNNAKNRQPILERLSSTLISDFTTTQSSVTGLNCKLNPDKIGYDTLDGLVCY
jgi:hypothetical protein